MNNPQQYLLTKIVGYETNGLKSLGRLNAEHIDDLSEVMRDFATETLLDVISRLNKGESIDMGDGKALQLQTPKRKRK